MSVKYGNLFESWELQVARGAIRRFQVRWRSIAYDPTDDLMQDLLVHWLSVRREFDPRRGRSRRAFMRQVMRNKLFSIVREREAARRSIDYSAISLDRLHMRELDQGPLYVTEEQLSDRYLGAYEVDDRDAQIDITKIVNQLSPFQRKICGLLGVEGLTVDEASHRLHVSISTVYREIRRLRKVFREYGFEAYLKP